MNLSGCPPARTRKQVVASSARPCEQVVVSSARPCEQVVVSSARLWEQVVGSSARPCHDHPDRPGADRYQAAFVTCVTGSMSNWMPDWGCRQRQQGYSERPGALTRPPTPSSCPGQGQAFPRFR